MPRTSVLGAVYLTGYLGGAIATHVRVGSPLLGHTLFPTYVAAFTWGGLVLRNPRLLSVLLGNAPEARPDAADGAFASFRCRFLPAAPVKGMDLRDR